ncbi:hypothetical protein [Acetobacter lovaniensis]|uniref:Ca2+-binding RTX toxin-like protein n=1 Tax=Acetobacter lovaniensis TaxID=104100 RepID=A0A841QHR9_9PROT|nr:hypothetical protein [Acetobacter lovaniensis]MBB6457784.1 Ca2+-binding RTX toxin-like protein [Acetobacter lovaniensis]NHN81978.1 hypothetical protein [Acetobacter lovaniensis]GBQ72032.1 hypothetical protein AA0474_2612 [Acetobacter lovaniensis NRIC 0474]
MTDTQQVEQNAPAETNKAQITLNMLRQWGACQDGKSWFSNKFPQGAEYGETMTALYADKKYSDARWLARNAFDKAFSKEIVISDVNSLIALTKDIGEAEEASGDYAQIGSSGDYAHIGSSGYDARIGSSGDGARIGSSGDDARIGSSGNDAQIGSSGDGARIGSSGNDAQIGSSGDYARIGSSGDDARIGSSGNGAQIEAAGRNSVTASSGGNVSVKLGKNGAACLAWHDGERNRFTSLYEGEDGIKEGVWYRLGEDGLPVAVEAA